VDIFNTVQLFTQVQNTAESIQNGDVEWLFLDYVGSLCAQLDNYIYASFNTGEYGSSFTGKHY